MVILRAICGIAVKVARFDMPTCKLINELDDLEFEGIKLAGLAVGLIGALIGGAIFRLFNLWPGLESVSISLRDIVAAFIGSLIFLLILWIIRSRSTA
jgi:uncharacterized membrane protein YeaQ/YmgE (transglycosylase-associated protein family)